MPIFEYNGKKYNVKDEHIDSFMKDFPEASTIMEREGKKYRVRSADYRTFLSEQQQTEKPTAAVPSATQAPSYDMDFLNSYYTRTTGQNPADESSLMAWNSDVSGEPQIRRDIFKAIAGRDANNRYEIAFALNEAKRTMGQRNDYMSASDESVSDETLAEYMHLTMPTSVPEEEVYEGNELKRLVNPMKIARYNGMSQEQIVWADTNRDKLSQEQQQQANKAKEEFITANTKSRREVLLEEKSRIEREIENLRHRGSERRSRISTDQGSYQFGMVPVTLNQAAEMTDPELGDIAAAEKNYLEALREIDRELEGVNPGFWEGVLDATVRNPSFWTLGLSDLQDTRAMLRISENGINDANDNALADALYTNSVFRKEHGFMYRAGNIFGYSIPFMVEFAATFGYSGVSNAGGKVAAKIAGEAAENSIKRRVANAIGATIDDMVEATLVANTAGAGHTLSNIAERKAGQITMDDEGNYTFINKDGWLEAAYKGEMSSILEIYTEKLGYHLDGKISIVKGLDNIGASRLSKALMHINNSDLVQLSNTLFRQFGINNVGTEILEEEANLILNSIFVGDNSLSDLYDPKTQLDICGGMLLTIGTTRAIPGTIASANYINNKRLYDKADKKAEEVFGDDWSSLRERINGTPNEDIADFMYGYLSNADETKRVALLDYYKRMMIMRGYNLGSLKRTEVAPGIEKSYQDGYGIEDNAGKTGVKDAYDAERARVESEYGNEFLQQLDNDPTTALAGLDENKLTAAYAYLNAKAKYDGMLQRVRDDIDERINSSNAIVDERTNQTTGLIHGATMKQDDRRVYVISGNLVQYEDGSGIDNNASDESIIVRDADTGELEQISPEAILNIDEPLYPDNEKLTAAETIRQQFAQDAANIIDGIPAFAIGETYTIVGDDAQIQVQIVANQEGIVDNGDGTVNVSDGVNIFPLAKETIQQQAKNARMAQYEELRNNVIAEREHLIQEASRPQYALNDLVSLRDENGNAVRGNITTDADADGRYEVYTEAPINGKRVNLFTRDELDSMLMEHNGVAIEQPAENVADKREQTSSFDVPSDSNFAESNEGNNGDGNIPGNDNNAPENIPAMQRIPKDMQGNPLYEQTDSDTAWDAIVEQTEGDEAMAQTVADGMVADKEAALKKLEKAKSKGGATIAEKIAAEKERKAAIDAAQQELNIWKKIAGTANRRRMDAEAERKRIADEAAALRKAEEERLRAEREEAERIEREALNGVPDIVDDTPQDARARGYRRVSGHKIDRQEPLQAVQGKEVAVRFSDDAIANGRVAVIDATQLQPSHIQGVRNPFHFIDEAQPKERNDEASVVSARKIAENIRPEEITSSVTAYTGAPTVNARGEVIQGNNRSDALRLMWDSHQDQAAQYKQYLIDHAEEFGLNADDVAAMERPVLVNMLDVDDAEAITLGQFVAQDTESGGTERIKPKNALQKMGNDMRSFANLLLKSNDEDTSFAGLVDNNGVEVLKWMSQRGYITPTQYKSAFDSKGNLTAEAKNDLRGIMYQSIFKGGSTRLEEMFNAMPAKAQKAILATAFRDYDSPNADRMIEEIQNSIRAFYALSQSEDFVNAKTFKDARLAVEGWKIQYQIDDVTGESYLPAENFSNFALLLATMYKGENQSVIQGTFNKLYDLIQGTQEPNLFEQPDNTPRSLAQAIYETLNITYDGQQRSNVLVGDSSASQRGQQGSTGDAATGERIESGERTADSAGSIEAESTTGGGAVHQPQPERKGLEQTPDGGRETDGTGVADDATQEVSGASNRGDIRVLEEGLDTSYREYSEYSERTRRTTESERLVSLAKQHGLFIPAEVTKTLTGKVAKRTGESVVYIDTAAGKVTKVKDPYAKSAMKSGVQPEDAAFEHLVHNLLFPETAYTLDGISEEMGDVRIVLSQDFIQNYEQPTKEQIAEALAARGLFPEDNYSFGNELLSVTDVEGDNVLLGEDGTVYFIDPIIRFKKPLREILAALGGAEQKAPTIGEQVQAAEAEVNTTPTDKQKEAGNYKKGHVQIGTFNVTIEQPKGSVRSGVDADGKKWETEMKNTYGYIRGTEGVDGDHIDVFLSDDIDGWDRHKVFVVDQRNADGSFDEHKVMLGFNDINDAEAAYMSNYEEGWQGLGAITGVSIEEFEKWIASSHRKTKAFAEYKSVKATEGQNASADKDLRRKLADFNVGDVVRDYYNQKLYRIKKHSTNGVSTIAELDAEGNEVGTTTMNAHNNSRYSLAEAPVKAETPTISQDSEQVSDQDNAPYTIAPARYTTKKGKVLDMHLVKFAGTLTKEQQRAAKELAKAEKGWYDREQGGFMMRSEESAKQLADTILNNDDAVSDAQPVSLADTRKIVETEQQVQPTNTSGNRLVTDERYAELRERMRKKLGGQMNIGIDPEILAIGTEMAVYHLEKGARKFTEYAKAMIADLGDAIRPYLKAFYNGARNLPEVESSEIAADMTPYDEVQQFNVSTFDKEHSDPFTTAEIVVAEQAHQEEAEQAKQEIINQRNTERRNEDEQTSASTEAIASQAETVADKAESDIETATTEEQLNDVVATIDKQIEEVNKQLALLGYYEADIDDSQFHESYGYMRSAEKKAVKDADTLAKRIVKDLGIDPASIVDNKGKRRKVIAQANIAPAGGNVYIHLPLTEDRELYISVDLEPDYKGGNRDNLFIDHIMLRIENPTGQGYRYVGRNVWVQSDATYTDVLDEIRAEIIQHVPEFDLPTRQSVSDTEQKQPKAKKSKEKAVNLQQSGELGLFDSLFDNETNNEDGLQRNDATRSEGVSANGNRHEQGLSKGTETSSESEQQDSRGTDNGGERTGDAVDRTVRPRLSDTVTEQSIEGKRKKEVERNRKLANELKGVTLHLFDKLGGEREISGIVYYELANVFHCNDNVSGPFQATRKELDAILKVARKSDGKETFKPKNTRNNHSERGKDHAPTSVDARIEANIKAIELAKQLLESGEQATEKQMQTLRKFSGWGGLGKAFSEGTYYAPNNTAKKLRELLGEKAYQEAVMSANSAYYTPAYVVDTLWDIAEKMGFEGGNILEGSAGIGNILGQMPTHISERSDIHAIEIDGTSGSILSLLYPDANVEIQGFEQTHIDNGTVDLAITNVPFVTGLRVNDTTGDKDLSKKFHNIHDFCIAKNVRKLREGGLGIFITSNGTLDNSKKLRDWIVSEGCADFVGAFRMHNKTFGGTGVTSDIIVIRKRVNGQKSANAIDVSTVTGERMAEYDTGETRKVKGKETPVIKQLSMDYNRYFVEHPENMAGEMHFAFEKGDTFRPTSKGLYPKQDKKQEQMLAEFVQSFTAEEFGERTTDDATGFAEAMQGKKLGELFVKDGKLYTYTLQGAKPLEVNANKVKGHTKVECFEAYTAIKEALAEVLAYQTSNESDEGLKPLLDSLNRAYDDFVATYGHFNKNTAIAFLRNDVDYASVFALERFEETADANGNKVQKFGKTDVFSKRVVEKEKEPTPTNVKDGIIASIFKFGRVDVPYIAEQLGVGIEDVKKEIIESGYGFENPATRQIEASYQYLSGNVREKLRQAEENNENGAFDRNIKALQEVMPMDIPAHLIDFTLGSSWIEPKLYEEYVKERTEVGVQFTAVGGTWFMKEPYFTNYEKNRAMGVTSEMLGRTIMGHTLIEAAIQNRSITVSTTKKRYDGSTETITDKEATQACAAKIDEIRQDFKDWARQKMQSDPEMSALIERIYNDTFNNFVPMSIPDEFVPEYFGGASHKFKMRPHQGKAIVRGTQQPLLLAHEVGTGKTFTLISTAMEMRRLGTARKPMIVVQNATVGQFVASAKELYPNAKILTLEEADRTAEGRKNFYAKIRYNDWDMIVVPQSTFEFIPDSEEREMAFVQDKIEEKMLVLEKMKEEDPDGKSMITRQAEREIELLEEQLAGITDKASKKRTANDEKKRAVALQNAEVKAMEMLDRRTDDVENFDDMGIDALLVDEAHEYKHLGFATAMQRGVKGVDPSYSKKSQGVFLKTQAVLEKNNGRNVIFATGTPISNTAAEIWTFMRYLMPADTMKEYGIYYFDDFVRNFGNIQQMLEFTTSGKFKENNRFAGYVNLPELVRIWSGVSDTVLTKEAGGVSDKIPEMEGGKAQDLYLPQTRALRSIMKFVKGELEKYEQMSGKEKKELEEKEAKYAEMDATVEAANDLATAEEDDELERDGVGSYTDDELVLESDPVSKALGNPRGTRKQRREFAQRERRRMAERVENLAKKLHLDNIEVVTDVSTLEGKRQRSKGFYTKSTGKITIVIPNHSSAFDVEQTLLHEAVAHYGLRQLFGKHFDTFLNNVFNNADETIRRRIVALASKNGWDFLKATEEYLGMLAENTEFRNTKASWWRQIKELFLNMLHKIGFEDFRGVTLTDNELRYILWRSYENLAEPGRYRSILGEAADVAKQYELGVGNFAITDPNLNTAAESDDDLYRDGDPEMHERELARDRYERRVKRGMFQSQEALQDSMLGLKEAMQAILGQKTNIEDVDGFENAYLGENRLSSVNKAEADAFAHLLFKPMLDEVAKLARNKAEREELTDYMMAKHGLERNAYMRNEAINNGATDADQTDYAGLTALTGMDDVADAEAEAQRIVDDYEQEHETADLWEKVNAVSKAILQKSYECGMMSKETFDKISEMYEFYIPLRGFDEKTSAEAYAYLSHKHSAFNAPIKKAEGRKSKADDPFANLQSMAEGAIMQGNRNKLVKQRFLNFALNHPSDLVSVSDIWVGYDAVTNEWKPVFPDNIESTDTPEEVEQKMQDFETKMEALAQQYPDQYKKGKDAIGIPYRIVESRDLRQHQVIVKRGGRDYVITINGNPRAAQALNGQTNPDNDMSGAIGAILRAGEKINRQLSAFYTTRNPDFIISNFVRDMLYTNIMSWVKESPNYALRFHKNYLKVNPVVMKRLLAKYRKGTLDMSNKTEAMFHQFMMNGGETGYANIRDIEKHKNDIKRELRKSKGRISLRKAWDFLGERFDEFNRAVENCARFAAFVTSREMGRSTDRAIYDAKEISVNFNKKGSGAKFYDSVGQTTTGNASAMISGLGRSGYVFWNAAIQGTTNFGRQMKRHPAKAITAAASMFLLGALIAYLGGDDDEEDKDAYYNLPEYVRRSNILFGVGDSWISIPLPIEFRAFYGMGELMTSILSGKEHQTGGEIAEAVLGQATQVLPIDFLEGGGGLNAFIPSAIKPVWEAYVVEKSWTGMPLYKDTPWNKDMPEWTKAYKSANKHIVNLASVLNEATGGDPYTKGTIDINPAKVEYILNGYFGGAFGTIDKLVKMGETAFGDREYDPRNILLVNRLVKAGDERTEYRAVNNEYFRLKEEHDQLKTRLRHYEKDTDNGIFDYAEKIDFLYNSPEYERYEIFEYYRKDIDDLYDELKEAVDEEERRIIEAELNELKKELIEEANQTRKRK